MEVEHIIEAIKKNAILYLINSQAEIKLSREYNDKKDEATYNNSILLIAELKHIRDKQQSLLLENNEIIKTLKDVFPDDEVEPISFDVDADIFIENDLPPYEKITITSYGKNMIITGKV